MMFPNRLLRVKAESHNEAERWEEELQKAHMLKVNKHAVAGSVGGGRGAQFDSPLMNSYVPQVRLRLTYFSFK
jgi:hypothetical protein